ncbi:hypothetical protein EVAR_35291_1 [Eumeta japonica]|uniref:Uncharacterized protein n=1 Tax=Eumeta variegata TaxID=151549 RepID=A0A4C1XHH5_EUMVA|nr:hypothetical protein EVAR_35291_1 [Eumeta japonica]
MAWVSRLSAVPARVGAGDGRSHRGNKRLGSEVGRVLRGMKPIKSLTPRFGEHVKLSSVRRRWRSSTAFDPHRARVEGLRRIRIFDHAEIPNEIKCAILGGNTIRCRDQVAGRGVDAEEGRRVCLCTCGGVTNAFV